jgi:hypothetical protein
LLRSILKVPIVVSCADYAVSEVLLSQPAIERHNILYVVARVHEISGVDEDISRWNRANLIMETVRVGDEYQSHQVVLPGFRFLIVNNR